MNLEEIKDTITRYDNLYSLAVHTIRTVQKIDRSYMFNESITNINFCDETFEVVIDYSGFECYYTLPLHYLTLSNDELKIVAKQDMDKKLETERITKEEKLSKELQEKEKNEIEQYIKLKQKYEKNI